MKVVMGFILYQCNKQVFVKLLHIKDKKIHLNTLKGTNLGLPSVNSRFKCEVNIIFCNFELALI